MKQEEDGKMSYEGFCIDLIEQLAKMLLPAIPDRKNLLLKTTGIIQPITKLRFSYLLLINAQKKVEGQPHRLLSLIHI